MSGALNGGEDPEKPLGKGLVAGGGSANAQAGVTAAVASIETPTKIELNEGQKLALLAYFHALTVDGLYIPAVIAYLKKLPKNRLWMLMANNPAIAQLLGATVTNRENPDS